jgi:hypothetical protein
VQFGKRAAAMACYSTIIWAATVRVEVPEWLETKSPQPLLLHMEEIYLPPHASGLVRIYMNLPEATWDTGTDTEKYLGYFSVVPRNSKESAGEIYRKSVVLNVSSKREVIAGERSIQLTLVVSDPNSKPEALRLGRAYFSTDK